MNPCHGDINPVSWVHDHPPTWVSDPSFDHVTYLYVKGMEQDGLCEASPLFVKLQFFGISIDCCISGDIMELL